jgi:hypothetical protein
MDLICRAHQVTIFCYFSFHWIAKPSLGSMSRFLMKRV